VRIKARAVSVEGGAGQLPHLVNLYKADPHSALPVLGGLDAREDGVDGLRDHPRRALLARPVLATHGVRLATTRLAVCARAHRGSPS